MKRTTISIICLVLIGILSDNAPAAVADPLWERAVRLYERHHQLYAQRIETEAAEFDGRGNQRAFRETVMLVTLQPDGSALSVLTTLRDNGKPVDVTDATTSASAAVTADSSAASAEGREAAMSILHRSPFDPRLQDRVAYRRVTPATARDRTAEGSEMGRAASDEPSVEFRYTLETSSRLITGSAWLRVSDGVPVRSKATIDPLPRFVRELVVEQFFTESDVGHHVSEARIRAEGGFLFFQRRSEITMRFLDHACADRQSGRQPDRGTESAPR